ncbi:MAG: hypothetical protein ABIH86_05005 [Planctomycetota bacterium]
MTDSAETARSRRSTAPLRFGALAGLVVFCLSTDLFGIQLSAWESAVCGAGEKIILNVNKPVGSPPGVWTQSEGSNVAIENLRSESSDQAAVRLIRSGRYVFVYTDSRGKDAGRVIITVPPGRDPEIGNRRPVALAEPQIEGGAGQAIALRASLRTDADGDSLWFHWRLIGSPSASAATILRPDSPDAIFITDRPGDYRVELTVADSSLTSEPNKTIVAVAPRTDYSALFRPLDSMALTIAAPDSTLADFIASDSARSLGIKIALSGSTESHRRRIAFRLNRVTAGTLLDALAWQAGASVHYLADSPAEASRTVVITTGFEFLRSERDPTAFDMTLAGLSAFTDPDSTSAFFNELLRDYALIEDESSRRLNVRIVRQTDGLHISGGAPRSVQDRLQRSLEAIAASPSVLPAPAAIPDSIIALGRHIDSLLISLEPDGQPFDETLFRWADAAGVNALFSPDDLGDSRTQTVSIDRSNTAVQPLTAREWLDALTQSVHLRYRLRPDGVVQVYRRVRAYPTGQSIIQSGGPAVFPLRSISDSSGMSADWIVHHIRTTVYPDSWPQPGATLALLPGGRELFVYHLPDIREAVLEELRRLSRDGAPLRMADDEIDMPSSEPN